MPFFPIPKLWGFDLKKIRKWPKNGYSSFGESLFFFPSKTVFDLFFEFNFFLFFSNIFYFDGRRSVHWAFFEEKSFFGFSGEFFDTKIHNFFKKLYLEYPEKFLVNLFFEKTTYTYVELCQEHAGDSGFSRKNRFSGQKGQNMQILTKFSKNRVFLVILTMKMIFPEKSTNPSVFLV